MKLRNVLLAALLVFVVAGTAMAADTIKIGVYLPLTGRTAFGGQLELEGIQMAHKEMSEVLGKKVELVVVDNKTDKVEAANAVKRLIEYDKVVAVIGTYGSSLAMAGGEVAEAAKVPMMGTSCTNPLVTQGKMYVFRACFIDPFQGAGAATYAINSLKMNKAALLIDVANDYCVGLANFFKQSYKKLGGEIVSELKYNSGDQDFTAQLTEIISQNPDLLFIPADFAEGAIIMKQARELGAEFQIMGGDAMDNPEIVNIGGEAVEGFI
ncbi:MAG TPA: ABC transporter substrate-binding protein, partial [Synergistales bacterium]|nr:ABC transporter substrate-binding protein [Synergistales bacterium]